MDNNLFEGGIAQLEEIKAAIEDENRIMLETEKAWDDLALKEKEIAEENQMIEDKIQEVLKERRNGVSEPHNLEVERADDVLKESIRQRNAAKEVAVNKRITSETAVLHDENIQREYSLKSLFKSAKMPRFCRKPFYYSLYAPKKPLEFLTLLITAIIAIVVIPLIVILLVDTTTVAKVFLWIGIAVFFALVYLAVFFWTQPRKNRKILELARPDMEQVSKNKQEMNRMTRKIRRDKDESGYGLEELDNEIVRNRGIYDNAVANREMALKAFEDEIMPSVRYEVQNASAETMNRLIAERDYLKSVFDQKQQEKDAKETFVKQNYSSYVGKKNMNPEKIDQLIAIINEGKATNILEALDVQKEENKITNRFADAKEKIIPEEKEQKEEE